MAESQKEHDLTKLKVGGFSQETLSLMLPSEPGGTRGKLLNISYSMSLLEQFVLKSLYRHIAKELSIHYL